MVFIKDEDCKYDLITEELLYRDGP